MINIGNFTLSYNKAFDKNIIIQSSSINMMICSIYIMHYPYCSCKILRRFTIIYTFICLFDHL